MARRQNLWGGSRHRLPARPAICPPAFTLIEVLVVVAVIALLLAILIPHLSRARMRSRVVRVHADLHQITVCLEAYAMDNRDRLPPTRCACGAAVNNQLPVELARQRYLPKSASKIPQAAFEDFFNPGKTYKYLAPGPIYLNGQLFDSPDKKFRPRAKIWVPADFPRCKREDGRWFHEYTDEPSSPVRYAVWSMGPDPTAAKFPRFDGSESLDESQFPLRRQFWMLNAGDTGLIVHARNRAGFVHTSP